MSVEEQYWEWKIALNNNETNQSFQDWLLLKDCWEITSIETNKTKIKPEFCYPFNYYSIKCSDCLYLKKCKEANNILKTV